MKNQFEFVTVEKKSLSTFSLIFFGMLCLCVTVSITCFLEEQYNALLFLLSLTATILLFMYFIRKELYDVKLVRVSKLVLKVKKKRRKKRIRVISKIILTISCLVMVLSIIYAIYSGLKGT